jgi:hypothetical protein
MTILPAGKTGAYFYITLFLFFLPLAIHARAEQNGPLSQHLVREGAFAVRLLSSLGLGAADDEPDAESSLGESGIAPGNGWIADYPVTPDILGEVRESVRRAAQDGRVRLGKDDALRRIDAAIAACALSFIPLSAAESGKHSAAGAGKHHDPAQQNKYYSTVGPPVITYYDPPPEYSRLYCLVPYPFRSHGSRFSGFFILRTFHRTIFVNGKVKFVTNTFHVFRKHALFRIDPIARFNGKSYAGIGVSQGKGFIETGIIGSGRRVFNSPQPWVRSDGR